MLRYAIERLEPAVRIHYLGARLSTAVALRARSTQPDRTFWPGHRRLGYPERIDASPASVCRANDRGHDPPDR